jgi:hypothetical protein
MTGMTGRALRRVIEQGERRLAQRGDAGKPPLQPPLPSRPPAAARYPWMLW